MTKTPRATKDAAPKEGVSKADAPKVAKAEAPPKSTKVEQPKAGHKPNALQQPLQPSAELAAVVDEGKMPRGEVISKPVWRPCRPEAPAILGHATVPC